MQFGSLSENINFDIYIYRYICVIMVEQKYLTRDFCPFYFIQYRHITNYSIY